MNRPQNIRSGNIGRGGRNRHSHPHRHPHVGDDYHSPGHLSQCPEHEQPQGHTGEGNDWPTYYSGQTCQSPDYADDNRCVLSYEEYNYIDPATGEPIGWGPACPGGGGCHSPEGYAGSGYCLDRCCVYEPYGM